MDEKAIAQATARAIELAGGAKALSKAISVPLSTVYYWWDRGRIPVERGQVLAVETAVQARVTRYELRPDVYGPG